MLSVTIIGAGRVGLPLALSLEESGLDVGIKDINIDIINALIDGIMPFNEPGYANLIKNTNIIFSNTKIPKAKAYIITVGTPLKQHIETDLSAVTSVIQEIIDEDLLQDSIIILRSTVAPNTIEYLTNYINIKTGLEHTKDYIIGMCPERIAEGLAKKELSQLPQLIGVYNEYSYQKIKEVFYPLIGDNTIKTTPLEAELAKLFCNIYRYINFAIPNYFLYLAKEFNVEPFRLLDAMSINYPRVKGLAKPGFSSGACVRGDRKIEIIINERGDRKIVSYSDLHIMLTPKHPDYIKLNNKVLGEGMIKSRIKIDSFTYDLLRDDEKIINESIETLYTGKMYTFELENGKTFECTKDHLIPVKSGTGIILKTAKNINENDILYIK